MSENLETNALVSESYDSSRLSSVRSFALPHRQKTWIRLLEQTLHAGCSSEGSPWKP